MSHSPTSPQSTTTTTTTDTVVAARDSLMALEALLDIKRRSASSSSSSSSSSKVTTNVSKTTMTKPSTIVGPSPVTSSATPPADPPSNPMSSSETTSTRGQSPQQDQKQQESHSTVIALGSCYLLKALQHPTMIPQDQTPLHNHHTQQQQQPASFLVSHAPSPLLPTTFSQQQQQQQRQVIPPHTAIASIPVMPQWPSSPHHHHPPPQPTTISPLLTASSAPPSSSVTAPATVTSSSPSSTTSTIRTAEVEAALRSKPQRGRKRDNLSVLERLELTRTRNREHARSTRVRKKQRYEQLLACEQTLHDHHSRDTLRNERRLTLLHLLAHRSRHLYTPNANNTDGTKFLTASFSFTSISPRCLPLLPTGGWNRMTHYDRQIQSTIRRSYGEDRGNSLRYAPLVGPTGETTCVVGNDRVGFLRYDLVVDDDDGGGGKKELVVGRGIIHARFELSSSKLEDVESFVTMEREEEEEEGVVERMTTTTRARLISCDMVSPERGTGGGGGDDGGRTTAEVAATIEASS